MTPHPFTRRTFLKATLAGAALAGAPRPLSAQPKTFKIAAVGVKSKGGLQLELVEGDTQSKPENGRVEAERLVNEGAKMLLGSFDSGSTAAMVSVAQQKRVPFLIDIAAADPITANVDQE